MTKAQKNFRVKITQDLTLQLLNSAVRESTANGVEDPLGVRLRRAVLHLEGVIQEANHFLEGSELAGKLATALMVDHNKRGFPDISVDVRGVLMLEVGYAATREGVKRRRGRLKLPLLSELRQEAQEMGVDISHLGAKRRAVQDFIEEVKVRRAASGYERPKPKPEPEPESESESVQMGAEVDELTVEPAKRAAKPPRRAKVKLTIPGKTTPKVDVAAAAAKPSPNLAAIMESAPTDVDIEDLLSEPERPQPASEQPASEQPASEQPASEPAPES